MTFFLALAAAAAASIAVSVFVVEPKKAVPPTLDFTIKTLDGHDQKLADYEGKVVLIVNTASKCGFTKQYKGLEALSKKYADKGVVVLGFPANNFNQQEPGSDEEIASFCEKNYGVTFPMFSKISVKGDDQHPLYKLLTSTPGMSGDVKWNFEKFLLDRHGKVIGRYLSAVEPESKEITDAIDKALAEK